MPRKNDPSSGWAAKLGHTVVSQNGPSLATLHDARAHILALPKKKQSVQWDNAIRCLLQAAETGTPYDIRETTRAIEL